MRRIQGAGYASKDAEEEKRRTRESVLSNLVLFGVIIGVIRCAPLVFRNTISTPSI